jgi:thiol:disulfide interchange protein
MIALHKVSPLAGKPLPDDAHLIGGTTSTAGSRDTLRAQLQFHSRDEVLDKAGIWMSSVCLIHCLGVPLLAIVIPTLENLPDNDSFIHGLALLLIVPVALISFLKGYAAHRKYYIPTLGALGLILLIVAFFYEETAWHSIITSSGGAILVLGHILNLRNSYKLASNCSQKEKQQTSHCVCQ